jgi:histone H3/H4
MAKAKIFAWSPIREMMKANGAEMVARDAVDELISVLERQAKDLTNRALEFSRHAGRKKVTADDMNMALKLQKKK